MPASLRWTEEQRTVLHLLRTVTDYDDKTNAKIFNHMFKKELDAAGYNEGLQPKRVREEYNFRLKSGRTKIWQTICKEEYSPEELQRREALIRRIKAAAAEIGPWTKKEGDTSGTPQPEAHNTRSNNVDLQRSSEQRPSKKLKSKTAYVDIPSGAETYDNDDVLNDTSDTPANAKTQRATRKKIPHSVNKSEGVVDHTAMPSPSTVEKTLTSERTIRSARTLGMNVDQNSRQNLHPSGGQLDTNKSSTTSPQAGLDHNTTSPETLASKGHIITGETTDQIIERLSHNIDNAYGGLAVHDDGDVIPADLSERENRAWQAYSDAVHKQTGAHLTRTPMGPPLEMIHYSDTTTTWKNDIPFPTKTAFIDHKDPVYKLGGKVVRAGIDGEEQDVMICNLAQCARCKLGKDAVIVTESKTDGLPFIHVSDFYSTKGVGFNYLPRTRPYSMGYPKRMWKTKVTFRDGKQRQVMACEGGVCELCSGQDTVAKKAARYEIGGDLYERKKAQESWAPSSAK